MSFETCRRLLQLNAYERHKALVNEYILTSRGSTKALQRDTSKDKRDIDVIRENYHFIWDEDKNPALTWEQKLAKKYYDKLYKEYCICDLIRYKENKVALRWRIESEVISGKGQFSCGNKSCGTSEGLRTWEVNFGYKEADEKKYALVKIRLCPPCSEKLNYHHKKKEIKRIKKQKHHKIETDTTSKKQKDKDKEDEREHEKETEEAGPSTTKEVSESELWKQPTVNTLDEKTRDEEFSEYLQDLFL